MKGADLIEAISRFMEKQKYSLYIDESGFRKSTARMDDDFVSIGNILDGESDLTADQIKQVEDAWNEFLTGEIPSLKIRWAAEYRNNEPLAHNFESLLFDNPENGLVITDDISTVFTGFVFKYWNELFSHQVLYDFARISPSEGSLEARAMEAMWRKYKVHHSITLEEFINGAPIDDLEIEDVLGGFFSFDDPIDYANIFEKLARNRYWNFDQLVFKKGKDKYTWQQIHDNLHNLGSLVDVNGNDFQTLINIVNHVDLVGYRHGDAIRGISDSLTRLARGDSSFAPYIYMSQKTVDEIGEKFFELLKRAGRPNVWDLTKFGMRLIVLNIMLLSYFLSTIFWQIIGWIWRIVIWAFEHIYNPI